MPAVPREVMGRISSLTWLSEKTFRLLSLENPTLINEAAVPLDAAQTRPSQLNRGLAKKGHFLGRTEDHASRETAFHSLSH